MGRVSGLGSPRSDELGQWSFRGCPMDFALDGLGSRIAEEEAMMQALWTVLA
jgi:hypothetical protein